ncbi:MAG: carboxymuconolactone decarboxylase family protein, partial [Rickettsiales bacterium]|nr:carboxymuconolactone decarboxylase family protein [Rickettsiales bacterium]
MDNFVKYTKDNAPSSSSEIVNQYQDNYGFVPNFIGYTSE